MHLRTASNLAAARQSAQSISTTNQPITKSNTSSSSSPATPSKDKDKMKAWSFPRSSPQQDSSSGIGIGLGLERGAGGSGGVGGTGVGGPGAHEPSLGLSSATSPTGLEIPWNGHTLPSISESSPANSSPTPQSTPRFNFPSSPPTEHEPRATGTTHRPNTSIAYSFNTSSFPNLSLKARLNPLLLAKITYSNLRRSSLNDLFYGLVFIGTVLIFFGALSGQGYNPSSKEEMGAVGGQPTLRRVPDRPRGVWPALKQRKMENVEVEIPKQFLPEEVPADVHQPHGDSSHDQGDDFLRDSPEDSSLDDDQTHQVQRRRGREALFAKHTLDHATSHAEAEALLDAESTARAASTSEDDDEDDEEDDEDDDDEPDETSLKAFPVEEIPHEDSFDAHPLHIIDEDAGELSPPDFFHNDATPPPPAVEKVPEPELERSPEQELGDSFRRPAGREGLEELQAERAAMGRARENWLGTVHAGTGEKKEAGEVGEVEEEMVKRQKRMKEVR
ncbi:hypothetical protein P7C70_g7388, partial [Phenoliferia sp. Uapishka_3]